MKQAKQPHMVRGNLNNCPNYKMCPICYGCRNYDERDSECIECYTQGIDDSTRNFNVCDTNKHESWKVNMMITKPSAELKDVTFGDEDDN